MWPLLPVPCRLLFMLEHTLVSSYRNRLIQVVNKVLHPQQHPAWSLANASLQCRFLRQHSAAVRIQSAVRGHLQGARYQQLRAASIRLQSAWRAVSARSFSKKMRAARVVQRHFRGFAARAAIMRQHQAATQIQVGMAMVSQLHLVAVLCNTALPRGVSIVTVRTESVTPGLLEASLAEELLCATEKSSYCSPGLCSSTHCPKALRQGEFALYAVNAVSASAGEGKPSAIALPPPCSRSLIVLVSLPHMKGSHK